MTFLSNILREFLAPETIYKRELISTPDGGQFSLDWFQNPNDNTIDTIDANDNKPIALFLPGLTGSSKSEYIRPMVKICSKIGYIPIVLNHRGTGNTPLLTARLYCAANDDDLRLCLNYLRKKFPKNKLIVTGVSLGGIILTRYLITSGKNSKIDAAFLISVCWDFISTTKNMERFINFPLNNYLCKLMINIVNDNSKFFINNNDNDLNNNNNDGHQDPLQRQSSIDSIDLKQVRKSTSLREFDESFTRRMFNFNSVEDYYLESSYKNRLKNIKTLTLCLNSIDDMFAPLSTLPIDIIENSNDNVCMILTSYGGHIGFMDGFLPFNIYGKNNTSSSCRGKNVTTVVGNNFNNHHQHHYDDDQYDYDGPNYFLERLAKQYFQAMFNCKFEPFL